MMSILEDIFTSHNDKKIVFEYGKNRIIEDVMTKDTLVKIVTKILSHKQNGKKFKSIEDQKRYFGI